MESLVLISIVILLVIVGFYAWFTYKILQELRQENRLLKGTLEQQLKLSSFPHLYCDMQTEIPGKALKLEMYNIGSVPAYDIHISVIGAYTEEGIDISTFMRNFVQPRYRKYPLQADKVGYYGIRSIFRCPTLPTQKRLTIALNLPTQPVDIYALTQYRDVSGGNYHQVYCFSDIDEKGSYRANILEPQRFEPLERLHFYDMDDAKLPVTDKPLPFSVGDFVDLWNHSLSHRLTTLYSEAIVHLQEVHDTP
ncbi:hypothetical protein IQ268_02495 [Oculatella sp. LEGE 06141]|uniref:hypothetical protein n=1 Tax=Oculatella sp. LEGE 06141 TaxID=1828648 RepID=UPI0018805F0F|nr:hypothetical protein [Oculatella sp. LEGE 06141]MBE9177444.1 hypothetical protein [Oculatella sp. LEGE 06141]